MTISANVRKELFEMATAEGKLIRIKPTEAKAGTTVYSSKQSQPLKMWTQEEHEKFLEAMEKYPSGPWKVIAAFIGTKTTRQTMTHAQKYRQKISRWRRGLRHKGRKHAPDGVAPGSDSEYSAKENLFKAIEYVSGDGVPKHAAANAERTTEMTAGGQLFRLAELASFEVMKNTTENPAEVSMENAASDENCSAVGNNAVPLKAEKPGWLGARPSREWPTQSTGIKLSLLKQAPEPQSSADHGYASITVGDLQAKQSAAGTSPLQQVAINEDKDQTEPFRLPPLQVTAAGGNLSTIPPLRSKIDPTVLSIAQHASSQ